GRSLHGGKRDQFVRRPRRALRSRRRKATRPPQYPGRLSIDGAGRHDSSVAPRQDAANLAGVSLPKLSHTSAMNEVTRSPAFSVVVPLYNEEANLAILQEELRAALSGLDYEIIFVDDGSVDHTVDKIEASPNIRVIRFEKNSGQSAA